MVRLAVGGQDIQVDDDHLERLGAARTGPPSIRSCWAATTAQYLPVIVLELSGGLLIAGGPHPDADGVMPLALPWDRIAAVREVRHDWTMVLELVDGVTVSLLFASIAELHRVAEAVAAAREGGHGPTVAETGAPLPVGMAEVGMAEAGMPQAGMPAGRCSDRGHGPARQAPRRRVPGGHRPSPALDRIERRLASVETLLADLTTASHGSGGS